MKPAGVSVDTYLQEAAGSGAYDSEGVFTIAGEAAIGKLASFQLPRKSAWVLKAVQSAVAWGATTIEAKQTAEATYIGFKAPAEFDVAGLQKALLSVDHGGAAYLEHMACGLRAVGFGDRRPFKVEVFHGQAVETYRWDGQQLFRERASLGAGPTSGAVLAGAATPLVECTVRLQVDFPAEDRGRWLGGLVRSAGRARDEYMELVERCEVCPIPLKVDGRRLDTLTTPGRKNDFRVADLCVAWAPAEEGAQVASLLSLPQGVDLKGTAIPFSDRFSDRAPFFVDGDPSQPQTPAILKLSYHYRIVSHRGKHSRFQFEGKSQPSQCHWVSDGVICQSQVLRWENCAVALDLYLSAEGLATDLSGLTLRKNPRNQQVERLRKALTLAHPSMARLSTALAAHTSLPFAQHVAQWGGVGLLFGLCVPLIGKLAVAGVASVNLALSASDKASIVDHCERELKSMLRRVRTLANHPGALDFH